MFLDSREDKQYFLGCVNKSIGRKLREIIIPPFSGVIRQHLHPYLVLLSPSCHYMKDVGKLQCSRGQLRQSGARRTSV